MIFMAKVRIRKRGKTYSYIFEAGKKLDGKRRVIEKGGFATADEAYDAGIDAYADFKHGNIGITSKKILFKDFADRWLKNVASMNICVSSMIDYSTMLQKTLYPYIGQYFIQDITPAILDNMIHKLGEKNLSKNYLKAIKGLLHQIFTYAIYPCQLITVNPSSFIKVPKNAPERVIKRDIISPEQYQNFISNHPYGTQYFIPTVLFYHTGMRFSEVRGLCWDCVDFDNGIIYVKRQLRRLTKIGVVFSQPKTANSTRQILLDTKLIELLKKWKAEQERLEHEQGDKYCITLENTEHCAEIWSKNAAPTNLIRRYLVCTRPDGRPANFDGIAEHYRKYGFNAHSFRHTHATILIEGGASLKGVAGRLGHKKINITDEVYTHNTKKIQEDTLNIFTSQMQTKKQCRQIADKTKK